MKNQVQGIYYTMSTQKKIRMVSGIYCKIVKIAKSNLRLKHPKIDDASFIKKLHQDLAIGNRKRYENLFEQFLKEEVKI